MKQVVRGLITCGILAVFLSGPAGCQSTSGSHQKIMLWNGKDLLGWKPFASDNDIPLNQIWFVRDGVINCAGQRNGYLRTERQYANYHLHVEWRWPSEPSNSGVLLHGSGRDKVWPRCIECQLQAGHAGDFVLMNGAALTVDGRNRQDPSKQFVVIRKKQPSSENPAGQWNSYDIDCENGMIRCTVNGVLQNEGTNAAPNAGWIGLESEGGPIEFRNIYIELLD